MELFKTVPAYSWLFIYLFSQILKFTSSDVFVIKGFTVFVKIQILKMFLGH